MLPMCRAAPPISCTSKGRWPRVRLPLPELVGHRPQLGVAERCEVLFDRVDLISGPLELAQDLALACAKDAIDDGWHLGRAPCGSSGLCGVVCRAPPSATLGGQVHDSTAGSWRRACFHGRRDAG